MQRRGSVPHRRRPNDPGPMGYETRIDMETLEPDSDVRGLLDRVISVTPLSLDMTSRVDLDALAGLMRSNGCAS